MNDCSFAIGQVSYHVPACERAGKEQRDAIGQQLDTSAARPKDAIAHDAAGRTQQAHALWRSLLGADYPEKGG